MNNSFDHPKYGPINDYTVMGLVKRLSEIGDGSTRKVFALDNDTVLKVSKWEGANYTNMTEAKIWDELESDQRRYFAPVLASSEHGSWLVMQRANPLGSTNDPDPTNSASHYKRIIEELEANTKILDLWSFNVGTLSTGQHVVIDYGAGRCGDPCQCDGCRHRTERLERLTQVNGR